jgi:hypothetical protein
MNLSKIIYNLNSPHIFVDCDQQEVYGQLFYSIKTLREYSSVPVVVYSNAKVPLNEFEYMRKHRICDFDNVEIVQYDSELSQENIVSYCIEQTFENYDIESALYITSRSVFSGDPTRLFDGLDDCFIYRGRESYTECNVLLIHSDKVDKFLNGANIGFKIIPTDLLKLNINSSDVNHSNLECTFSRPIVTYQNKQTEYYIPSDLWNCSVSDRIRSKQNIVCHNCCKIIENPIIPEYIIQE